MLTCLFHVTILSMEHGLLFLTMFLSFYILPDCFSDIGLPSHRSLFQHQVDSALKVRALAAGQSKQGMF